MTAAADTRRGSALDRYEAELAALPSAVGGRNGRLVTVALHGAAAGLAAERIAADLVERGGSPPIGRAEAWRAACHAVRKVAEDGGTVAPWRAPSAAAWRAARPRDPREDATEGERGFVAAMVAKGEGATSRDLRKASPVAVPATPDGEAAEFVQAVFPDWRERFYAGEATGRRDEAALYCPTGFLARHVDQGEPLPPLVMPNPVTGAAGMTKDGRRSHVCSETVAAYRWAVIEFDDMPLKTQAAFWAGVVTTPAAGRPTALPVRSLVYSGGKSIHGILRIDAADAAAFKAYWNRLLRLLSSSDARDGSGRLFERCDAQCADPIRMTRVPGAWRADKMKWQRLLWLSPTLASERGPAVWDYPRRDWRRENEWRMLGDVDAGAAATVADGSS